MTAPNAPHLPPTPSAPPRTRRKAMLAGAALAAGLAGAAVGWWRLQPHNSPAPDDFWSLEFDTPEGGRLSLSQFQGRPLLVNFWATWCPPCIEELPLLDRYFVEKQANGWQMLGLAVDRAEPVQRFLKRQPLQFPVALAGMGGVSLSQDLGNGPGGLPFSLVFDADGSIKHRKLGQLTETDLKNWMS